MHKKDKRELATGPIDNNTISSNDHNEKKDKKLIKSWKSKIKNIAGSYASMARLEACVMYSPA